MRHPAPSQSPSDLPVIWTAPLKLQGNNSLVVSGPSKLGSTCEGPVHHARAVANSPALVDACSIAEAQGVPVPAAQPTADDCLEGLLSHRDDLVAAAVQLPEALQWPPIVVPWPPEGANNTNCASGGVQSARDPQECISCLWGTNALEPSGEHAAASSIGPEGSL